MISFSQYLSQKPLKRQRSVKVTSKDIAHKYPVSKTANSFGQLVNSHHVELSIHGMLFTYLLQEGSDLLYTMDQDGNKKIASCFFFED